MKKKNRNTINYILSIILILSLVSLYLGIYIEDFNETIILIRGVISILIIVCICINVYFLINAKRTKSLNEYIYQKTDNILNYINTPYIIVDSNGKIISYNKKSIEVFKKLKESMYINEVLEIDKEFLKSDVKNFNKKLEGFNYNIEKIDVPDIKKDLIILNFYNITDIVFCKQRMEDEKIIQGILCIDNYDEILSIGDDIKKTLSFLILEKRLKTYFNSLDGILQKIDRDKFLVVIKNKSFKKMQSDKFSILEEVKKINAGNNLPMTLSIGFVNISESFVESYGYAVSALDMALARGGDQVVFMTKDRVYYYGGRAKTIEKNTRVKARVKAHALKTVLENREKVIIMGHKLADIDCFGAAIGVYTIAKILGKEAHIVIDKIINSVRPSIEAFKNDSKYPSDMFIKPVEAYKYIDKSSTLVIVDVNAKEYTEEEELLDLAGQIVVIDHHRKSDKSISNAVLDYVESTSSSTCEMITAIIQYLDVDIKTIDKKVWEALYAGILIDTNSFVSKVGVRTFEVAAFLKKNGVDIEKVRKMFRENSMRYLAKAQTISDAYEFTKGFLIGSLIGDEIDSPTELGAQAANELLNIEGIKASVILTKVGDTIYISLRSIDEVNVQLIAERLGGGGHQTIAGAQLKNVNLDEAKIIAIDTVNKMIEGREI